MLFLSGSTHGKGIVVAETTAPGTLIHLGPPIDSGLLDLVSLWVSNLHTSDVSLTLEWGGAGDPYDLLVKDTVIPLASPPLRLTEGFPIRQALELRARASVASKLIITGYAEREVVQ